MGTGKIRRQYALQRYRRRLIFKIDFKNQWISAFAETTALKMKFIFIFDAVKFIKRMLQIYPVK